MFTLLTMIIVFIISAVVTVIGIAFGLMFLWPVVDVLFGFLILWLIFRKKKH